MPKLIINSINAFLKQIIGYFKVKTAEKNKSNQIDCFSIGIDVGTSGIRLVVVNGQAEMLCEELVLFTDLEREGLIVWDEEKRLNVTLVTEIIDNQIKLIQDKFPTLFINTLSFSSIGPSIVFLDENGNPIGRAFTYAYQGAEEHVVHLPKDFQAKIGGLYSASLPYVQLLEVKNKKLVTEYAKITTINDYLTWQMTELPLEELFTTVPNASYTGLYSLQSQDWDETFLKNVGLKRKHMPKIIPLGTIYPIRKSKVDKFPILKDTKIVAGTIDGIDAFWAAGVKQGEKILVGSASTTGALRRWRKNPTNHFHSRLVLCCHIVDADWVEIIPFNNVGTSLHWLANVFYSSSNYKEFLEADNRLNLDLLEKLAWKKIKNKKDNLKAFLDDLPVYFPYGPEGEPRGPHGRGKNVPGGFVNIKATHDGIDQYIALQIGLVCMYRHNLEVLNPPEDYKEIRLTGTVAQKCSLFRYLLATITGKNIGILEKEQSVAWATAMRALVYSQHITEFPKVLVSDLTKPSRHKLKIALDDIYRTYIMIYEDPDSYTFQS
ncbi:MAG: FGGY family carbohydrate kinase [Promethearchaeota archaeon]